MACKRRTKETTETWCFRYMKLHASEGTDHDWYLCVSCRLVLHELCFPLTFLSLLYPNRYKYSVGGFAGLFHLLGYMLTVDHCRTKAARECHLCWSNPRAVVISDIISVVRCNRKALGSMRYLLNIFCLN
jgi:hypothetical protein